MTTPNPGAPEAARRHPTVIDVLVREGADRLRVRPWHDEPDIAYVAPVGLNPVREDTVHRLLIDLEGRGARTIVTAALAPAEQRPFLAAGFSRREHLRVLERDLRSLPVAEPPQTRTHRARRADRRAVLAVDDAAFDTTWRLGSGGLDDALRATPTSRFRVIGRPDVVAYAVSGEAGPQGFVQRLAVAPAHQHHGMGTALVSDGLRWMRRHGASTALVNTQETNEAALSLYQRLGFRERASGLDVLARSLG